MEMFAIVKFCDENDAPAVVATNWIDKNRNVCFYPNVKTELQKNKLLLGREDPRPEWTTCPIKILREFANYTSAKDHLSEAELTSNLESEAEGSYRKKRQRKERRIILPGEEYSSSDSENADDIRLSQGTKQFSNTRICLFPPPPPPSHNTFPIHKPPGPSTLPPCSSSISLPLAIEIPRTSSQSSASSGSSGSSSSHGSDVLQLKRNQELMWKVLEELSKTSEKLTKTSERLEEKMDKILSILEVQPPQPLREAPESPSVEGQLFAHLPIKVKELDGFEEKLKEPAIKQRLMKYLLGVGGKDVKALAANLMKKMFVDEIGEKYSLTGKSGKEGPGKKPFMKTECFRFIFDICLRKFRQVEESHLRESVSDWLMQAKFRKL